MQEKIETQIDMNCNIYDLDLCILTFLCFFINEHLCFSVVEERVPGGRTDHDKPLGPGRPAGRPGDH